jgi:hypothetical protein
MTKQEEMILETLLEELDLPDSAYEIAKNRYEDLGEWFNRDNSTLKTNNVHIFPQGSFMLGTAIRPVQEGAEYDLDLACKLRDGVNKSSHSQKELKSLVGGELEAYRKARGIKEELAEKHRCWCLEYRDNISFHMDIVPAIPADDLKKSFLLESMNKFGTIEHVAKDASQLAISITDDRDQFYTSISDDWNISNPEGYGVWFAEQMETIQTRTLLEKAKVDDLPVFKRKTPLQRCIQLLKRHRDMMFKDNQDSKPISIIITTLAARAYNGETEVVSALTNILDTMPEMLNSSEPRVPNPVNPEEDFADKWGMEKCSDLRLEDNFHIWVRQAQSDFQSITKSLDPVMLNESFNNKFAVNLGHETIKEKLGLGGSKGVAVKPKEHTIQKPSKPWKQ